MVSILFPHHCKFLMCEIFTARKRSLGQRNVFTPVCDSVHGGGGFLSQHASQVTWPGGEVSLSRGVSVHGDLCPGSLSGRPLYSNVRAVCILLECILVSYFETSYQQKRKKMLLLQIDKYADFIVIMSDIEWLIFIFWSVFNCIYVVVVAYIIRQQLIRDGRWNGDKRLG